MNNIANLQNPKAQIKAIKKGLPFNYFEQICKEVEIPESHLTSLIRISTRTLANRKKKGVFSFTESERLFRIKRVYNIALKVFEDTDLTKKWFKNSLFYLQGQAPIDFLDTEIGAREVENLLGRVEHGVFS